MQSSAVGRSLASVTLSVSIMPAMRLSRRRASCAHCRCARTQRHDDAGHEVDQAACVVRELPLRIREGLPALGRVLDAQDPMKFANEFACHGCQRDRFDCYHEDGRVLVHIHEVRAGRRPLAFGLRAERLEQLGGAERERVGLDLAEDGSLDEVTTTLEYGLVEAYVVHGCSLFRFGCLFRLVVVVRPVMYSSKELYLAHLCARSEIGMIPPSRTSVPITIG